PTTAKIAIVAARFNAHIVDELLSGCVQRLATMGIGENRLKVHRVPGAFELPIAADALARTKKYSAIICLGCVIRGDTPHFDYVAGEAARGIADASAATGIPMAFGLLTTTTVDQAT